MVVWRVLRRRVGYFDRRPFEALPRELAEGEAAPQETLA